MSLIKSIKVKSPGDLILGISFMSLAAVSLFLIRGMGAGTASQMGPAYFPRMLAVILLLLGGAIVFKSFVVTEEHQLRVRLLPVVFVIGGTVLFGIAAEQLGALLTVFCMVVIYSLAYPGKRNWETIILAVGSAVFSTILFIVILGLPLSVWPRF